jgi:hypothetical protein
VFSEVRPVADQDATVLIRLVKNVKRRALTRYTLPPEACATVVTAAWTDTACVVNLSAGGVGLLLRQPLSQGAAAVVQLEGVPGGAPEFPARVCHSTPQAAGEWFVGCEFSRQLDEEELRQLLTTLGEGDGPAPAP